jgi:hypothetical protein
MTWAATLANGRGELSYRFEVERYAEQWVTHAGMATATRFPCLSVRGTKLKSIANPVTNDLDVSGFAVRIIDKDGLATASFGAFPTQRTWITADVTDSATSIAVRSTTGFPSTGTIWLDSEAITYTSVTGGGSPSFNGLTRGALGSLAQYHYITSLGSSRFPEVTNRPVSMAGCRGKLYVYGQNDDPQGDGTLIWQGIVTRHPTFAGSSWQISLDPITSVLDRTISADLAEPATPRGIYYHALAPFKIRFIRPDVVSVIQVSFPLSATDRGFFESNEDFCSYLSDKIEDAVDASWSGNAISIVAVADGASSWHLEISTDGTIVEIYEQPGVIDPTFSALPYTADGLQVGTAAVPWGADEAYAYWPTTASALGAGSVPRGYYGSAVDVPLPEALAESFAPRRIYLSSPIALSTLVDACQIHWQSFSYFDEITHTPSITTTDTGDNFVEFAADSSTGAFPMPIAKAFTSASIPEIRFGRTFTDGGSVWTTLSAIITAAPVGINAGGVPDLRSSDFDSASWDDLDELSQPRIVRSRVFKSFSDVSLAELVKAELSLAGYFLSITATGTISISPIRNVVQTTRADWTLDGPLVSDGVPTWEPNAYGVVNQIQVRRGYDGIEDEYSLATVIVRNVGAFCRNPRPRPLVIEPKSVPAGNVAETYAEIVELSARMFSVFSAQYAKISISAPLTHFVTAVGGSVGSISTTLLPDGYTGSRGVEDLKVTTVGREIDLDSGNVAIKCVAVLNNATGYAPQSLITAESNISGNTWDVTLQDSGYLPSGTTADDWFLAGDVVLARLWDSTTGTTLSGTVASATANVVRVTFSASAAALTSGDWFLSYGNSSGLLQSAQFAYCFLADSTGLVDNAGAMVPADSFG